MPLALIRAAMRSMELVISLNLFVRCNIYGTEPLRQDFPKINENVEIGHFFSATIACATWRMPVSIGPVRSAATLPLR